MPDFKLEVTIREVSQSDLEYVISQIRNAVEISGGKANNLEASIILESDSASLPDAYATILEEENDNLELSTD